MRLWDVHQSHTMSSGQAIRIAAAAALAMAALWAFIALRIAPEIRPADLHFGTDRGDGFDDRLLRCAYGAAIFAGAVVLRAPARLLNVQAFVSTPLALGLAVCLADHSTRDRTRRKAEPPWPRGYCRLRCSCSWSSAGWSMCCAAILSGFAYAPFWIRGYWAILPGIARTKRGSGASVSSAHIDGLVLTASHISAQLSMRPSADCGLRRRYDFFPIFRKPPAPLPRSSRKATASRFPIRRPKCCTAARLPPDGGQNYWAALGAADWCQISRNLGVTALVAPTGWIVKLPPIVREQAHALPVPCN